MHISYITATQWNEPRLAFIREGEKSLAAQTETDIEWIIASVNPPPGCLDGLVETQHVLAPRSLGIRTCVGHLLNEGMKVATGEYLAFMDDDNRKLPNFGEAMTWFIAGQGMQAAYSFARVIDGDGRVIGDHHVSTTEYPLALHQPGIWFNDELVVKRQTMEAVGGFDVDITAGEDYDMALRLCRDAGVGRLGLQLVDVRVHGDQWTQKDNVPELQAALHRILAKHGGLNDKCPICQANLDGLPYAQTHIAWLDSRFQRFCTHPASHPTEGPAA